MGVTKPRKNPYEVVLSDDDLEIITTTYEEDLHESPVPSPLPASPKKKATKKEWKLRNTQVTESLTIGKSRRQGSGIRRNRRLENLNHLLTLVDSDEALENELLSLTEPSSTVFSVLLNDQEKLKIWNDFNNQSEEAQERTLQKLQNQSNFKQMAKTNEKQPIEDQRNVHPAFGPEERYKHISREVRGLLRKRQVPKGYLIALEEEVTVIFETDPTSVFISKLSSSFERMILHGICQYLNLNSQSFDDEKGGRHTQVENENDYFCAPNVTLNRYLETRYSH